MALAGIATVAAWLTGGVAVLVSAHQESERLYDERLRDLANVILSFANHEIEEIRADGTGDVVHQETAATLDARYRYQVWSKTGELLLLSHDAPRAPFAPLDARGFVDRRIDGRPYCIYARWSADGEMQIQVAEDESLRDSIFVSASSWLLVFFVVSTVVLVLVNRWMFGRATRALDQSAQQLLERSADDLRPIAADDPPRELAPLLDSINKLFGRFERALDNERHFTAAAAHELRTPLAAVRVQAQVAERARSPDERRRALADLGVCVDRAARLIDQLLTLARIESPAASVARRRLRVDEVAAHVVEDLAPLLQARALNVELDLQPCEATCFEFGLASMLRNLVDNAARYTPPGGRLRVACGRGAESTFLTVEDSGPGIPVTERDRVFERFYRSPDTTVDGCGIGLSIVRGVVQAHAARIELSESGLGGLRACVHFPDTRAAAAPGGQAQTPERDRGAVARIIDGARASMLPGGGMPRARDRTWATTDPSSDLSNAHQKSNR
jgi:signal transduction histidine kinase